MNTKVYTLPAKFWDDHDARENDGGEVVRRTARTITVRCNAAAYLDLHSDAALYAGFTGDDFAANRGVCLSARTTLRRLEADPFPPDLLAAESARQAAEWEAGAEVRAAEYAARRARYAAERAEAAAYAAAHPRVEACYYSPPARVFGVERGAPLIIGARIAAYDKTAQAWRYFDITSLGPEWRGNVAATLTAEDGSTLSATVEVC